MSDAGLMETRVRSEGLTLSHGGDPRISLQQFLAGEPPTGLEIGMVRYEPGGDTGEPKFHSGREFLLLVNGDLEVTVGDQVFDMTAGQSIYFDSRRPHRGVNRGSETTVAVYVLQRDL